MSIENFEEATLNREQLFHKKYSIAVEAGGGTFSTRYRESARALYHEAFAPLIPDDMIYEDWFASRLREHDQQEFENDIDDPDATLVTAQGRNSHTLVGFTCAYTSSSDFLPPLLEKEFDTLGMSMPAFQIRQQHTAEVGHTMIKPAYRSTGMWSSMMDALELQLITRNFNEMVRFVRQDDNYADKLRRRYQGRIITDIPDLPSYVGPQTYFRITL